MRASFFHHYIIPFLLLSGSVSTKTQNGKFRVRKCINNVVGIRAIEVGIVV